MTTVQEQIESLEEEVRKTPYHKGTERHIGILRARIAKLKDRQVESGGKGGGGGVGYAVKKQGDATVVLVGPPSVGKSTLINKLTNAQSKVAPYAFTTLTVIPGMMNYNNAYIQILDVPGIIKGAEEGKGRGKEVLSVVRGCDLIIIITDPKNSDAFESIENALYRNGIRINQKPPDVSIEKRIQGGISVQSNIKQELSLETIKDIAYEYGIRSADITLRERVTLERLIDAFSSNRVYVKGLRVLNKVDEINSRKLGILRNSENQKNQHIRKSDPPTFRNSGTQSILSIPDMIKISAEHGVGLEELKQNIWQTLGFVIVYLVEPFQDPTFESPVVMHQGQTLLDVARDIGSEFAEGKKSAKIWNTGAKFPGQEVSLTTKVQEGMQVRFL